VNMNNQFVNNQFVRRTAAAAALVVLAMVVTGSTGVARAAGIRRK